MLMFLQCMESLVHNGGGKLEPSLASLAETEIQIKAAGFQPTSADVSKAKRKFPWSKTEVKFEKKLYSKSPLAEMLSTAIQFSQTGYINKKDSFGYGDFDSKLGFSAPRNFYLMVSCLFKKHLLTCGFITVHGTEKLC